MAAPNAPLPLRNQVNNAAAIVVTVPLQSLDRTLALNPAGPFNTGGTTATYTMQFGAINSQLMTNAQQELCDVLDRLQREGVAVVT